jgi:predicted nucleic acid-binding protein
MILLDTNIFIIDRFFKRDDHYASNKRLVEMLPSLNAGISVYTLLEICGLASFNLSSKEFARWFYHFDQLYEVKVLFPRSMERTTEQYFDDLLDEMYRLFVEKMTFLDAAILSIAEEYAVSYLVTWNTKDFVGRTAIKVTTPAEFVEKMVNGEWRMTDDA